LSPPRNLAAKVGNIIGARNFNPASKAGGHIRFLPP
jgi:hypothetical protein